MIRKQGDFDHPHEIETGQNVSGPALNFSYVKIDGFGLRIANWLGVNVTKKNAAHLKPQSAPGKFLHNEFANLRYLPIIRPASFVAGQFHNTSPHLASAYQLDRLSNKP